jgi:hypothetical protein
MVALRWGVILIAALLGLGACEAELTPEDEVIAQYQRGEDAIANKNPVDLKNSTTNESWALLTEAQKLALECSATETKKLNPSMMRRVIVFRNRIEPEKLASMTVDDLIMWQLQSGYWVVDQEYGIFPHSVQITGDTAVLQMGVEAEEKSSGVRIRRRGLIGAAAGLAINAAKKPKLEPLPGYTHTYRNINGYWYYDDAASEAERDQQLIDEAKEFETPVADYIVAVEEEEFGSIKKDIWKPVGKKKK